MGKETQVITVLSGRLFYGDVCFVKGQIQTSC